jgi:hypothetical protein
MSNIEATATFLRSLTEKEHDLLMELASTMLAAESESPPKPVNLIALPLGPAPVMPDPLAMADLEPGISTETRVLIKRAIDLDPALEDLVIRIANLSLQDGESDYADQHENA